MENGPADAAMLRQSLHQLSLHTRGEGFTDITAALDREIGASGLATYLQALVPQEEVRPISGRGELRPYRHDDEGPDDMPAHIRTALTCTTLALPFRAGGC